ncbi:PhzF family phenazine biosynthesis protein [Streptacidiphilus sp. EB103A]|uniref:PhzF family phenazine biosynthesis protein n=1 Tax=Streptacidiphilus sp. EB103A TaxID=3156275 RepID=UPI0035124ED7
MNATQRLPYRLADVFTEVPLAGNQLAVFTGGGEALSIDEMQAIAREMNLSETVFVLPSRAGGDARVRLLSSVTEIDFAGHPLLGTACVLAAQDDRTGVRALRLETNVGVVPVRVEQQDSGHYDAWMDQPLPRISPFPEDSTEALLKALGVSRSVLPATVYNAGIPHLYLMADSIAEVEAIVPNFQLLGEIAGTNRINCFAGEGISFTTRMFSPYDYVPEDPACGSAAGPLAAHLVRHGLVRSGQEITLSQGRQVGRPSTLYANAEGTFDEITSVKVGGGVCLIGGGELLLPASATRPRS